MGDLDMSKMPSAFSSKNGNVGTSVAMVSEYDEYLGLCEIMTEDRLKKLVRKIEYVAQSFN